MSELALNEVYWDELLVLLPVTLPVIPLAQLFILPKILANNTGAWG